jgi:uncharacterized membrane protein HdeD (DUF308 family)
MDSTFSSIREAIRHWWVFLISGILLIGLGVLVLSNPAASYLGLSVYFAVVFLLHGLFEIVFSLANRNRMHVWGWYFAFGILDLVIGIILVANPLLTMQVLPIFIGFWLMFRSISIIGRSIELKGMGMSGWGLLMLSGVLGIFFSFMILFNPAIGASALILWTALAFIVIGIFYVMIAVSLKGAHNWASAKAAA